MQAYSIFWFRRDLRLFDNAALAAATQSGDKIKAIFIFDEQILDSLPADDPRVQFIYQKLQEIHVELREMGSGLQIYKGNPIQIWKEIIQHQKPQKVYVNKDYEPYARERDAQVVNLLNSNEIPSIWCKDQVIFEENEILKTDGTPYTVFTPYKKQWIKKFELEGAKTQYATLPNFLPLSGDFPSAKSLGFQRSPIHVKPIATQKLADYDALRDFPSAASTSYLGPHLRFGTVSVRQWVDYAQKTNDTFLSELIWREFFAQILWHFPQVVTQNFKSKYDGIQWRDAQQDFQKWCAGETGYPMVDAGMRELNATGYMHNRLRMVTASFLCKHLLIDWRLGEAYFAKKLLDFDLASNNGNWQWAAGTGCDAAPYFRIFNPESQMAKFDKELKYVKKWVPEFQELTYTRPMVEHKFARERALATYKEGLASR